MPTRRSQPAPSFSPDAENLTDADLDALVKFNPALKKKVDAYREIRAKELQIKARIEGGFSQEEPLVFCREVLGLKPTAVAKTYGYKDGITPDQLKVLEAVRDNKRVAVPSGHGTGKTFDMGVLVLWFLMGVEDSVVITSAPTWKLIEEQLWREIRALHSRSKIKLPGRMLQTKLEVSDKWYALGIVSDDPAQFRGFHGRRVLVVFDEATAIPEANYDEAESMIVGKHDRFVIIGNPTNNSSKMKQCCDSGMWHVVTLDARNHPNVIHKDDQIVPGAVTYERVQDWIEMYGGEDSPGFLVRAAGRWAKKSDEQLIDYEWVQEAQRWDERQAEKAEAKKGILDSLPTIRGGALGIDIAGEGSDLCVCTEIYNGRAKLLWWMQHRSPMETAGRIVRTIREGRGRYQVCAIDDTGIGSGVSTRVIEVQGFSAKPNMLDPDALDPLSSCALMRINFASSATIPPKHAVVRLWKIRDEMWWNFREALRKGQLGLPPDSEILGYGLPKGNNLIGQLTKPIWLLDSSSTIHVFDKYNEYNERTKVLPRKSPDIAHSLILANHAYRAVRPQDFADTATDPVEFRRRYMANLMKSSITNKGLLDQRAEEQNLDFPSLYDYL